MTSRLWTSVSDVPTSIQMTDMKLHFLDARGLLTDLRPWLAALISEAHKLAVPRLNLRSIDVVVQVGRFVIPEKGHVGYAHEGGIIHLTVDPSNPSLLENADESIQRMFAHELHHCARSDGLARTRTLGEALVAEGLAGRFAQEIFGEPLEPWERMPVEEILPHIEKANQEWAQKTYVHPSWFFGAASLPRWLGYSLGYRLVARYLEAFPDENAALLACASPDRFKPYIEPLRIELGRHA